MGNWFCITGSELRKTTPSAGLRFNTVCYGGDKSPASTPPMEGNFTGDLNGRC